MPPLRVDSFRLCRLHLCFDSFLVYAAGAVSCLYDFAQNDMHLDAEDGHLTPGSPLDRPPTVRFTANIYRNCRFFNRKRC